MGMHADKNAHEVSTVVKTASARTSVEIVELIERSLEGASSLVVSSEHLGKSQRAEVESMVEATYGHQQLDRV
jgi:hypothetical protein